MRFNRELFSGVIIGFLLGTCSVILLMQSTRNDKHSPYVPHTFPNQKESNSSVSAIDPKFAKEPQGKYSEWLHFHNTVPITVSSNMSPQDAEENFYKFVTRKSLDCNQTVRIGHSGDGGWNLCMAPPFAPGKQCKVYSFGINNDWSFDDAISRKYGCVVRAFDPSMKSGNHRRTEKIWFNQTGIGGTDKKNAKGWKIRTLSSLFKEFDDTENVVDYLKMDVEYNEWDSIESMLATGALKKVKQFGFEIHTKELLNEQTTTNEFVRYYNILSQLESQGFRRWYWHYNHFGKYISSRTFKKRTCCYELVYININYLTAGKPLII